MFIPVTDAPTKTQVITASVPCAEITEMVGTDA